MKNEPVDFGYQKVSSAEKTKLVAEVFKKVASRYDLMNDFMSLGSHRLLKRILLNMSEITPTSSVLDLAGGTGDMTALFADVISDHKNLILADYSREMINNARNRLIDKGFSKINFLVTEAERLPLKSNQFDCICISFGFRNFTNKEQALEEAYRTLRPKGVLLILEFSKPTNSIVKNTYKGFQAIWPTMGKLLVGSRQPYEYLIESIEKHPNQDTLKQMLQDAKFESVTCNNFIGGIAAIHKGYKAIG